MALAISIMTHGKSMYHADAADGAASILLHDAVNAMRNTWFYPSPMLSITGQKIFAFAH